MRPFSLAFPFPARPARAPAVLALAALLAGCIVVPIPVPRIEGDGVLPGVVPLTAPCPAAPEFAAAQARIMTLVNDFRAGEGLGALRPSARLAEVAQTQACANAARGTISHVGTDGAELGERLRRGGYAWWTAAENTGLGFVNAPERMVNFWVNSPEHRANLLLPEVTEAGLGLTGTARPAWVLIVARPR